MTDVAFFLKRTKSLVSASRYAIFLHTRGEWHEITDHIKAKDKVDMRNLSCKII